MKKSKKFYLNILFIIVSLLLGSELYAQEMNQEKLITTFKQLDMAINNGDGFSNFNNDKGVLAWAESNLLEAYLVMYEATHDKFWIDRFILHSKRLISVTDRNKNLKDYKGRLFNSWGSLRYSKPINWKKGDKADLGIENKPRVVFWLHSALIINPLVKFAILVKKDPKLSIYKDYAEELTNFSEKAMAEFNSKWRSNNTKKEGYYVFEDEPVYGNDFKDKNSESRTPINSDAAMGRVFVGLFELTGNKDYFIKASYLANKFKNDLILKGNKYIWHYSYQEDRKKSKAIEDFSHGGIEVSFAFDAFINEIIFNRNDMKLFANTLLSGYKNGEFAKYVDGTGVDKSKISSNSASRWLDLSAVDCQVYQTISDNYKNRLADPKREHPLFLLGIAKLLKYYDQCYKK